MSRLREMDRQRIGFEEVGFVSLALLLALGAAGAEVARARLRAGGLTGLNARMVYGVEHLPAALAAGVAFVVLVAAARAWLAGRKGLGELPSRYFVALVVGCFCLFWLPAVLAGGFDKDDWILLGAASVRKVLAGHPALAWYTLDSVDGNFRPLGTVLYMGIMLRHFGVWARPFLLGLFGVNLLGNLMGFAIVRRLGYSRLAAVAGALLYGSRSMIYPIVTWTCALGDGLVILLCGVMAWLLLGAIRRSGWVAAGLHLLAWGCFCVATLAKQSAFAAPLIVGLLLWLRPGTVAEPPLWRRLRGAVLGVAVYAATAAVPFIHAKRLLAGAPPYPVAFSFEALLRTFAYAAWFLGTFEFPMKFAGLQMLPGIVGVGVVCGVAAALWKVPRLLGERPRDTVFCLLAAVASVSLFVVLPARMAPYYGSMGAFWASLALGIALTRFGPAARENLAGRVCCFVFCMLLATGFADVRLKQTGLFPSGGYTWGASETGLELDVYHEIARRLALAPGTQTVLLDSMPDYDGYFAGMALTADPGLKRVLTHRAGTGFFANDRGGLVPSDSFVDLRDPRAYNWYVPMERAEAELLLARERALRLKFHDGKIESGN